MGSRWLLMLLGITLVLGCKHSALPLPPEGSNDADAPIIVPNPPPPVRAEIIPPRPAEQVVWVDGEWRWDRRRWIWDAGKWEVPPTGATHAHSKIVHLPDGSIGYVPGGWRKAGKKVAPKESR